MAVQLLHPIISKATLLDVGASRLAEAKTLLREGYYAGTVYLAGYTVECYLKAAICTALKWDNLAATFRTHDLAGLLHYTGLEQELKQEAMMANNFQTIAGIWLLTSDENIRYQEPSNISEETAVDFLKCVDDPKNRVVPWLQAKIQ